MKSNFEFLKEYWPALAQIGEPAGDKDTDCQKRKADSKPMAA